MEYSLCNDFLNSKKVIYVMAKYLSPYLEGKTDIFPWSVEIHPTSKCNHRCIHCSYKERNENRIEMPKEVFQNLIDSLIKMKVRGVYFSGGGEPCTYAGLDSAIKKLNENSVEVALVTNGTLFEKMGLIEVANHINYIAVSVPSCTEEVYEKITGRALLDTVLKLPSKIKSRWGNKSPIVGARVVITNLMAMEVSHILDTLKNCNYDYVLFKIVRDYEDRGLGLSEETVTELKKEVQILCDAGKINHDFTNLDKIFDYRKPYNPAGTCHINKIGLLAVVTPECDVYPNIAEIGNTEFCAGNLVDTNFENIWNSQQHSRVKEISEKHWQQGICKNCRAISYNVRINDMVSNLPRCEDPFL